MVMYTMFKYMWTEKQYMHEFSISSAAFIDLIYDCLNCAQTNDITKTALSMFQLFLSSPDSFLLKLKSQFDKHMFGLFIYISE
jgi:hypothetical protein